MVLVACGSYPSYLIGDVYKRQLYYMLDGRVRGVLMIDVWEKVDEARAVIEGGAVEDTTTLIGRISA